MNIVPLLLIILGGIIILFLLFYRFYFLRDPERTPPQGNYLISPADGKIITIERFRRSRLAIPKGIGIIPVTVSDVAQAGTLISIFMSVLDVHVNRAPIAGKIKYITHRPGKFLIASQPESTFKNEHCEILISGKIKVKVLLIAGFLARRIIPKINKGDRILAGQRIGMITLGSQVTLIIPSQVKVTAQVGDHVKAGTSILGTLP
ncbi:MAG: phosphatidylserine decarboxylase [Nanoarchaeota archaeon]